MQGKVLEDGESDLNINNMNNNKDFGSEVNDNDNIKNNTELDSESSFRVKRETIDL